MAPPNDLDVPIISLIKEKSLEQYFDLSQDGKLSIKGVTLLSEIPNNVSFTEFSSICNYSKSDAPFPLLQRVQSTSHRGGFFGFEVEEPANMIINSLGKFHDRNFLSIFRFKTWWSTQWVGKCGSDLQMETQWVLLEVPEIESYVLIVPLIEDSFLGLPFILGMMGM